MAALFASGALVIGLVGAVAAAHGAAGDGTTAGSLRADSAPVAAIVAVAAEHGSGPTDAASVAPTNTPVAHAAAASGYDGGVASPENLNAVLDVIGAQVGDSASTPGGSPQRPGGSASASGGSASSGPDQAPTTTVGFHEAGGDGQVVVPAVGATSADTSGDTTTTIAATNTTDTTTPTTSDASAGTGVSKQHTGHHGARHRKGDGEAEQQAAARRKETTRRKAEAEHHAAAGNHQHTPE